MNLNQIHIKRRLEAARDRGQTFVVVYEKADGEDCLTFMDEYRTEWEEHHGSRYWFNEGYAAVQRIDLYEGESQLQRARRIRNSRGNWESWRT